MNEQERLVSDQMDPQTAKLIGVLDSYRELFEKTGGDPVEALVNGIEYALEGVASRNGR